MPALLILPWMYTLCPFILVAHKPFPPRNFNISFCHCRCRHHRRRRRYFHRQSDGARWLWMHRRKKSAAQSLYLSYNAECQQKWEIETDAESTLGWTRQRLADSGALCSLIAKVILLVCALTKIFKLKTYAFTINSLIDYVCLNVLSHLYYFHLFDFN